MLSRDRIFQCGETSFRSDPTKFVNSARSFDNYRRRYTFPYVNEHWRSINDTSRALVARFSPGIRNEMSAAVHGENGRFEKWIIKRNVARRLYIYIIEMAAK